MFSKVDLLHGYHQIPLHEESRYITTFVTHSGIYRYKRLVQGATSALEIFQYQIAKLFTKEELIFNICDDILVGGRDKNEHNKNVRRCLTILEENGLTVNPGKCIWGAAEVTFFGHVLSSKGMKPTTGTVEAVKSFKEPKNKKEGMSFFGLVNYVSSFIPNLAIETEPLRKLLCKDMKWQWGDVEAAAFNKLKELVKSDMVLTNFDPSLETKLTTDAGAIGLGAV